MQPYIFPYIGYWQLIHAVDQFVLLDNVQFTKGWYNRNYILLDGSRKLFTLPLRKDSRELEVRDRYLADNANEKIRDLLETIKYAYRKAPFFVTVFPIVEEILKNPERNLARYLYHSIIQIKTLLRIDTPIFISSEIPIEHTLKGQDRIIELNKQLGADTYINPIGGVELYRAGDFRREGIELRFLQSNLPRYKQFDHDFVPSLSIIDVLMFNSIDDISEMLNDFSLVEGDQHLS